MNLDRALYVAVCKAKPRSRGDEPDGTVLRFLCRIKTPLTRG